MTQSPAARRDWTRANSPLFRFRLTISWWLSLSPILPTYWWNLVIIIVVTERQCADHFEVRPSACWCRMKLWTTSRACVLRNPSDGGSLLYTDKWWLAMYEQYAIHIRVSLSCWQMTVGMKRIVIRRASSTFNCSHAVVNWHCSGCVWARNRSISAVTDFGVAKETFCPGVLRPHCRRSQLSPVYYMCCTVLYCTIPLLAVVTDWFFVRHS